MKSASLAFLSLLFAAPFSGHASEQLIPAGSLIQCTISEHKLSSKNTAVGDPVLCQVGHAERYGRSVLPYNSYLVGRFEDYKDPGHFVGKGWMELKFDRMVIEPNTVIPIDARVVDVPGYKVDREGRILGKGHAVRDVVLWSIPILWPVDLMMLPMRGPRPTLKEETRVTLKVMDDLEVPNTGEPQRDPYGLIQRSPSAYSAQPAAPEAPQDAAPETATYDPNQPVEPPAQSYAPAQPDYAYAPAPPVYAYAPAPPAYVYVAPPVAYGYASPGYRGPAYRSAVRPPAYRYGMRPPAYGYGAFRPGYGYHAPAPRVAQGFRAGGSFARGGGMAVRAFARR